MKHNERSGSWQDVHTVLSQQSTPQLLRLLQELYALNTDNRDFLHAQVLPPKTAPRRQSPPKTRQAHTPKSRTSKVTPKIRQLANIAAELHEGASFNITRLTTLKSLCEDSTAAARFAVHLAQLTYKKMQEHPCPSHLDPEKWAYCQQVVDEAMQPMAHYLEEPTTQATNPLWALLSHVRDVQNRYEQQAWGPVRIIESTEVFMIEYALSCLLQPTASADWGYRIARQYAERYNARYGTGLIPESAPMVEDIADFWCQYHIGKPLREWLR